MKCATFMTVPCWVRDDKKVDVTVNVGKVLMISALGNDTCSMVLDQTYGASGNRTAEKLTVALPLEKVTSLMSQLAYTTVYKYKEE